MLDELVRIRQWERRRLLQLIHSALEEDERVRAAWLQGSSARGTTDALSDLDLTVAVSADAFDAVTGGPSRPVDYRKVLDSQRGRWVAQIAEPLLLLEAPQNAPAGGAFLTSFFAGEAGPQQVDWEWLSQTTAQRPVESVLLFDRDGIPVETSQPEDRRPGPGPGRTRFEIAAHAVPWFWATLIWNAKHAARNRAGTAMPMLGSTIQAVNDIEEFLDRDPISPPTLVPDGAGRNGLRLLSDLVDRMEALRPHAPSLFAVIPTDMAMQASRFIRLADAMVCRAE